MSGDNNKWGMFTPSSQGSGSGSRSSSSSSSSSGSSSEEWIRIPVSAFVAQQTQEAQQTQRRAASPASAHAVPTPARPPTVIDPPQDNPVDRPGTPPPPVAQSRKKTEGSSQSLGSSQSTQASRSGSSQKKSEESSPLPRIGGGRRKGPKPGRAVVIDTPSSPDVSQSTAVQRSGSVAQSRKGSETPAERGESPPTGAPRSSKSTPADVAYSEQSGRARRRVPTINLCGFDERGREIERSWLGEFGYNVAAYSLPVNKNAPWISLHQSLQDIANQVRETFKPRVDAPPTVPAGTVGVSGTVRAQARRVQVHPYRKTRIQQLLVMGTQPLAPFPLEEQRALARFARLASVFEVCALSSPEHRATQIENVRRAAAEMLAIVPTSDLQRVQRVLLAESLRACIDKKTVLVIEAASE